jgi:hypothetical protein
LEDDKKTQVLDGPFSAALCVSQVDGQGDLFSYTGYVPQASSTEAGVFFEAYPCFGESWGKQQHALPYVQISPKGQADRAQTQD